MKQVNQSMVDGRRGVDVAPISRRVAVSTSGLAVLGILAGEAFGQEEKTQANRQEPARQAQERREQRKAFAERMRGAGSAEDRLKMIEEMRAMDRQRAIDDLKSQLGISDREWPVVKPRIEAVYDLVHPLPTRVGVDPKRTEVGQRSDELRELLRDEGTAADRIKTGLTALRAAQEKAAQELAKARQNLRQLLTLRQEAILVLNGLLD